MTREQKQRLAMAVLDSVGTLLEFWGEDRDDLADIDPDEAGEVIAAWMNRLPTGGMWDARIPLPR